MNSRPIYRMPVHFGKALGPRNLPGSIALDHSHYPKQVTASITVECNEEKLQSILPPGFVLSGPPVLVLNFMILKEIQWLGGRGYNIFMVSTPAHFKGKADKVSGNFNLVMFESLADPIITGRGELGANKVYANVQEPEISDDKHIYRADWQGFTFVEAEFNDFSKPVTISPQEWQAMPELPNVLNYKYIPKTGCWGEADVEYATCWSMDKKEVTLKKIMPTNADIKFNRASWQQLPTLQNIVNGLIDLELGKVIKSQISWSEGQGDVADVRIIK